MSEQMTLPQAITTLLDEFFLEEFVDFVRDEVRGEDGFDGLSQDHPRVQKFKDACRALREAQATGYADVATKVAAR